MARRGREMSSPGKFAMGLVFAGIGFALMIVAANRVVASGGNILVSPWWLVGSYFFQTVGELCLSPVGLSLHDQAVAAQVRGADDGDLVPGLVRRHADRRPGGRARGPGEAGPDAALFTTTTMSLFVAAIILALLTIPIRRMMREAPRTSS